MTSERGSVRQEGDKERIKDGGEAGGIVESTGLLNLALGGGGGRHLRLLAQGGAAVGRAGQDPGRLS